MLKTLGQTIASLKLVTKFVKNILPLVNTELASWRQLASQIPCDELRSQALSSIRDKKFHCQGGSVYSLHDGVQPQNFVKFVVTLQTISDYLDNLCDRAGIADEAAFRQLHLAMTDALDPAADCQDYYQYYPFKQDGGYLQSLVKTCQAELAKLPAYRHAQPEAIKLAALYSSLQTYKHLDPAIREAKMLDWITASQVDCPDITAWEFAAATGSTLGMFMLAAAAHNPSLTAEKAQHISRAYFPWISGLHILLDYFIDGAEDRANGDLNFIFYYENDLQIVERLKFFSQQARLQTAFTPNPIFTRTVVCGLLALYLSDPKVQAPKERAISQKLLNAAGFYTRFLYFICWLLRRKKTLS